MVANGANQGMDIKANLLFKSARLAGLWPDAGSIHRSSISRARAKLHWQIFQDILFDAVSIAYRLWPVNDDRYLWCGMSVFAIDGSKFTLPATEDIRNHFDPESGLTKQGKGHYPQCLVSTVYDVFRRLPIARSVCKCESCERKQMEKLIPFVPKGGVWLFDRGYPSYGSIKYFIQNYDGFFIFRCPGQSTFNAVEDFTKSNRKQAVIWLMPTGSYKRKVSREERKKLQPIKVRVIRLKYHDGAVSVLLTNLFNKNKYPWQKIIALYFCRWEVENYYRDEKCTLEIGNFHSKTVNGVQQELFAATIMSVIARTLMVISSQHFPVGKGDPQFKNAIVSLSQEAALLAADDPKCAAKVFNELLSQMARVRYYRPKTPRKSQPRVSKKPINKWNRSKIKKLIPTTDF